MVIVQVPTVRLLNVTLALPPETAAVVVAPAPVKVSVPVGCVPFTTVVVATVIFNATLWPYVKVLPDALTVVVVGEVETDVVMAFEVAFT